MKKSEMINEKNKWKWKVKKKKWKVKKNEKRKVKSDKWNVNHEIWKLMKMKKIDRNKKWKKSFDASKEVLEIFTKF